jgi:uncharacterized repeat protein (TIGR03806 family)
MKNALNLSFLLLLGVAIGCSDDSSGTGGTGGAGGGAGGTAGEGGEGGVGGSSACVGTGTPGNCHCTAPPRLSDWDLFTDIRNQIPKDGVVPFEVTSPLFTDYAIKHRFVTLTDGGQIAYFNDTTRWQSPVGTIYIKTFAFPPNEAADPPQTLEQLIETRLLVHVSAEDDRNGCNGADSCWNVFAYVYDEEDQTDAICEAGGVTKSVTFTDPFTDEQVTIEKYHVPQNGECRACHGRPPSRTLGPSTGMFNRGIDYQGNMVENQIDALDDLMWLAPSPLPNTPGNRTTYSNPVELTETCPTPDTLACSHEAARSWFDPNCAHCHAPDGETQDQGLFLDYASMDPTNTTFEQFRSWGVCRTPTSAGNLTDACRFKQADIWPGDPDNSLLLCRLESVIPGEMMPTLGRSVVDEAAVPIIAQWIEDLPMLFPSIPLLFDLETCVPRPTD